MVASPVRGVILLAVAFAVQGCAGTAWPRGAWTKPGVDLAHQRRDEYECERRANVAQRAAAGDAGAGEASAVYAQCMRERGYRLLPGR
jgi:hypothetical protein